VIFICYLNQLKSFLNFARWVTMTPRFVHKMILLLAIGLTLSCSKKSWLEGLYPSKKNTSDASPPSTPSLPPAPPSTPAQALEIPFLDSCVSPTEDRSSIKITPSDVIVEVPQPGTYRARLSAKAESRIIAGLNPDLKNRSLNFSVAGRRVGTSETNDDGLATLDAYLPLSPLSVTCYEAEYNGYHMAGRIYALPIDTPIFVSDIDEVISDLPELEVPLKSIPNSPALPNAANVLREISKRHVILYLTARDDALANKTRSWLKYRDFPSGPLKIWDWTAQNGLGLSKDQQGVFKQTYLRELKSTFPKITAGIGNRTHDANAYVGAGIFPIIINSIGAKTDYPAGTAFVTSWREVPDLLNPANNNIKR